MKQLYVLLAAAWLTGLLGGPGAAAVRAADLTIRVEPESRVAWIGIVRRFNDDGSLARPVDPKAKFEAPYCDRTARRATASFDRLPPGIYDAIVFLKDGTRIEGYHWPIFNEFEDPEDPVFQSPPPDEVAEIVREKILGKRYYENKVTPLDMAGDEERVRVLMQLLRDRKTSYDGQYGAPVATLRYEIWQFTNYYGGWLRDKKSKVLHRILDAKERLRKKTWVWDRKLGGFAVGKNSRGITLRYRIPGDLSKLPGLHPY
ncbi:MAG: hypothetical protein GXP27_08280 [Planctomycetes bacterium]|nr:hypothetical protein [Planctomycetota bacterium]